MKIVRTVKLFQCCRKSTRLDSPPWSIACKSAGLASLGNDADFVGGLASRGRELLFGAIGGGAPRLSSLIELLLPTESLSPPRNMDILSLTDFFNVAES